MERRWTSRSTASAVFEPGVGAARGPGGIAAGGLRRHQRPGRRRRADTELVHQPRVFGQLRGRGQGLLGRVRGEYSIAIQTLPTAADDQREQLVRRSAAKDSSLDILGLDVVWEAEFAEAGWIVPFTGERRRQAEQDAVKAALDTATWKGQLVAAPFNSNTQLLW
jgi:hypothetical protein